MTTPTRHRITVAGLLTTLGAEAGLVAFYTRADVSRPGLWVLILGVPAFLAAVGLLVLTRLPSGQAVRLVLIAGAVLQVCAISGTPITSDDDYRYMWDAKVQLAGTDPYRYPPSAPELRHLRDRYLFPEGSCPAAAYPLPDGTCSRMNRPTVPTIYPPVAQLSFDAMRLLSFGGRGQHVPLEIAAAVGVMGIAVLLARRGLPAWQVAIWAWCPVTIIELSNNAHIDWLATLLAVLGVWAYRDRQLLRAGLCVGAAAATKIYPALVGVALLRRRPVLVIGSAVALVALLYLPHVLSVGTDVIGYLPKYLEEEKYTTGGRYLLLDRLIHNQHYLKAAVFLLLAALAVAVAWRGDPDRPELGSLVMVAGAMALTTPAQGWYSVLLLALIAMTGRVEALPMAIVPTLVYLADTRFGDVAWDDHLLYRTAIALSAAGWLVHRTLLGRSRASRSRTSRSRTSRVR